MKNENQNNAQEQMQEQLCAYLFGELEAKDAAHVEQRLEESETWRAERQRLSGTIGLVREAMKVDPASAQEGAQLSEGALQSLALAGTQAAAGHGKSAGGASASSSPMRLFVPVAATVALGLGGFLAFQKSQTAPEANSERTAKAEDTLNDFGRAAVATGSATEDKPDPDEKRPVFNIKHTGSIVVRTEPLNAAEAKDEHNDPVLAAKAKLAGLAKNMPRKDDLLDDHLMIRGDRSVLLKYAEQVKAELEWRGIEVKKTQLVSVIPNPEPQDSILNSESIDPAMLLRLQAPTGAATPARSAGVTTGGDDWLLGKGEESSRLGVTRREIRPVTTPELTSSRGGGSYRGPGDSLPPGDLRGKQVIENTSGGTMPSPPNSAGPATPGPSAPTQNGLEGMGYAGGVAGKERARQGLHGSTLSDGEADLGELGSELGRTNDLGAFYQGGGSAEEFRARMEELYKRNEEAKAKKGESQPDQGLAQAPVVNRFQDESVVRETPEQVELRLRTAIAERAAQRHQRLIRSCIPTPKERPNAMYYRWWGDNPFEYTSSDALATFAADVDTASYTLARRYLTGGTLPTREQVRTEEFVNYFAGDIPAPTSDVFAVQTEMTASPFGGSENRYMLRVGIRGKVIPKDERPPMALVFVVDTSGSMDSGNRMDLVKHSLRLLGTELDGRDQVGVVSFSNEARLVLPMTSMDERGKLESAVQSLSPEGSTNVEDGIRLGYELLARVPAQGRLRRVVLISDGVANTGSTVADEILKSVKLHRESGIYLSTVGVGMGNHNDALLERLANRGDGICDYVDDADAARRAMVERFSGGFIPIARDLKIQVEFDSKFVLRYRQIGYENRAVADADFRNDAVDGGEVGSGHQVTALFELECVALPGAGEISLSDLGKVRLRYKSIETGSDQQVFETEHDLSVKAQPDAFDAASPGFARSVVAAQFAEVLRRSTHAAGDNYQALLAHARRIADLPAFAGDGETHELAGMIQRAGQLGAGAPIHRGELWTTVDSYRRHRYLCGTERELSGGKLTSERLTEIAAINADLEARIRDLSLQEAIQGR